MNSIQALAHIMQNPEGKITDVNNFDRDGYLYYDPKQGKILDNGGCSYHLDTFSDEDSEWTIYSPPKMFTLNQALKKLKENDAYMFRAKANDSFISLESEGVCATFDEQSIPFELFTDKVWWVENEYDIAEGKKKDCSRDDDNDFDPYGYK